MNAEQKQRIEQIQESQEMWRDTIDFVRPTPKDLTEAMGHIDFLLSLVKSQEAGAGLWLPIAAAPKGDTVWLVVAKIADSEPNKGAVLWWYRAMFWRGAWRTSRDYSGSIEPTHFFDPEQVHGADTATSMRSACVEKVRAERLKHEHAQPGSEDYEYHQAAAFALACVEDELKSLILQEQSEDQKSKPTGL